MKEEKIRVMPRSYTLTDKAVALVNGFPIPEYPNGTKVKLLVDMPDDISPLFAGDMGIVRILENGQSGFQSDRYGSISFTRRSGGEKLRVLDFVKAVL